MEAIQTGGGPLMHSRGVENSIHNMQSTAERVSTTKSQGEAADVERMNAGMGKNVSSMKAPETGKGTVVDVMG